MKKIMFLFIVVIGLLIMLFVKRYNTLKLLNTINNKKILIPIDTFSPTISRIDIFTGIKKEVEISANNLRSILSLENEKIFYFADVYLEKKDITENFVVVINKNTKRIMKKIKIPFKQQIFYIKKLEKKVYFSDTLEMEIRFKEKTKTPTLYFFDLESNEIEKLFEYDTEGLPVILENEIIYSREGKIYSYNIHNKISKYIFDGINPFEIENDEIYYEENGKIVKRKRNGTNKKIIYSKKGKNRRAIKKINDNVYVFIRLDDSDTKLPFDVYILEIIDVKNNTKVNLNKIFSREYKINKGAFYGLDGSNFIIYD